MVKNKIKLLYVKIKYHNDTDLLSYLNNINWVLVYDFIIRKNKIIIVYNDCIKIIDCNYCDIDNFEYTETYTGY